MSNSVDWSKAPNEAEFFSHGEFYRNIDGQIYYHDGIDWELSSFNLKDRMSKGDYQPRPAPQEKPMKYEYGVEYPTNGVKPDLPDDVLVDARIDNGFYRNQWAGERDVGNCIWDCKVTAFKITDKRFKTSELAEPTQSTNKYDRTITGKYSTGKCTIDVYRVLAAYDVTDSEVAHAVKKLLAPGQRGVKEERQDIEEAMQSLQAWIARMDDEGLK